MPRRRRKQVVYGSADFAELQPMMREPGVGLLAYKALLRAGRHAEAMDWVVSNFDWLPPETLVEVFGAWLATPPPPAPPASSRRPAMSAGTRCCTS